MKHLMKRIAYTFLYIPTLFVPNPSSVDFADKKRIDKMNLGLAVFINIIGLGIIFGVLFVILLVIS
jgi:hypothetical protein